jgi:hypothetical protein
MMNSRRVYTLYPNRHVVQIYYPQTVQGILQYGECISAYERAFIICFANGINLSLMSWIRYPSREQLPGKAGSYRVN